MRWVGEESSGQSAIMSTLGPRFVAADTTCARRPPANVTSAVGSLLASAAMLSLDEAASGLWTPKSCSAWSFSNRSRNNPKSFLEPSWASALAANMTAAAAIGANIFCMATLLTGRRIWRRRTRWLEQSGGSFQQHLCDERRTGRQRWPACPSLLAFRRPRSGGEHPTVHRQLVPGDEGGVLAGQEERGARDLVRGPESTQRDALGRALQEGVARLGRQAQLPEDGRRDRPGPHRVHAHAPRRQLDRSDPGEAGQCGLAGRIDGRGGKAAF